MNEDRVVLHIDMNSYFASVEQQANPLLRGKPIVVSGRPNIYSVVAAASIEAKRRGVKSGMSTFEAKKICPEVIFIPGDPAKYIDTTAKLYKIFYSYSPLIEVFSIDEVFMELDCPDNNITRAIEIAHEIKKKIISELGVRLTCSIGIAANKFMAKLASDLKKPDGLVVVTKENKEQILLSSKLIDFCGLGNRTLKKLNGMGIFDVKKLRETPIKNLVAVFGNVLGNKLHNMAYGIDNDPLAIEDKRDLAKSYSHNLTLPHKSNDEKYIWAILLRLSEKVARRMRKDQVMGRCVSAFWRTDTFVGDGGSKTLPFFTNDGITIFECAKTFIMNDSIPETVKSIGVGVSNIKAESVVNATLIPEIIQKEKLVVSMDKTNDRFGENTVFLASTLPCFDREKRVAGIRMKIRFN